MRIMVKYLVTKTDKVEGNMRATIDGTEYVDIEEAAEMTGYSVGHLRRLARQEKIARIKRGTMVFLSLASLESYVGEMKSLGSEKFSPWRD
jgi:predicted transcriptional regulator of viral defense system